MPFSSACFFRVATPGVISSSACYVSADRIWNKVYTYLLFLFFFYNMLFPFHCVYIHRITYIAQKRPINIQPFQQASELQQEEVLECAASSIGSWPAVHTMNIGPSLIDFLLYLMTSILQALDGSQKTSGILNFLPSLNEGANDWIVLFLLFRIHCVRRGRGCIRLRKATYFFFLFFFLLDRGLLFFSVRHAVAMTCRLQLDMSVHRAPSAAYT